MKGECMRDILLVLGRVALSQKSGHHVVSDTAFIKWLLAMPAFAGTTLHEARLVLLSLKRSGMPWLLCPLSFVFYCNSCFRASRE
jgi:hypothetical protein